MDDRFAVSPQRWSLLTFCPQFSLRSLLLAVLVVGIGLGACQLANVSLPYLYTGRPLDVAIHGTGYFSLAQGDNHQPGYYTRGGRFWVDESYMIRFGAPEQDLFLYPEVSIPCDSQAMFDADGGIYAHEPHATVLTNIGSCLLTRFANPDGLEEMLPGVYRQTEAAGMPMLANPGDQGLGTCLPGWIELRDSQRQGSAVAISPVVIVAFLLRGAVGMLLPRVVGKRARDDARLRMRSAIPPPPAPAGGA